MNKDNLQTIPVTSMSELIVGEKHYIKNLKGLINKNEGYETEVGSLRCKGSHVFDSDKEDEGVFDLDKIVGEVVVPKDHVRAFFRLRSDPSTEKIMFGLYSPDKCGTSGEMTMIWETFDDIEVPQLQVYDDAWKILATFKDVLDELAKVDNQNITQDDFVSILIKCGFKDFTSM